MLLTEAALHPSQAAKDANRTTTGCQNLGLLAVVTLFDACFFYGQPFLLKSGSFKFVDAFPNDAVSSVQIFPGVK